MRAYKSLMPQVQDLIKKLSKIKHGIGKITSRGIQTESFNKSQTADLLEQIVNAISTMIPPGIISGCWVEAENPPSEFIWIKGKGEPNTVTIKGQSYTLPDEEVRLFVPLNNGPKTLFVVIHKNAAFIEQAENPDKFTIAKIVIPSADTLAVQDDMDENGLNAYINTYRELLYENRFMSTDYLRQHIRNVMEEVLASNLIGTIVLNESLKILNEQGSLEMDSKEIRILYPDRTIGAKFNKDGIYFYNNNGGELANFTAYGGRIGNIRITTSTIESDNFITTVSGFQIRDNGNAEFNNLYVRGTLAANIADLEVAVTIDFIFPSTYSTLQDWVDTTQSAGKIGPVSITDGGGGTIDVGAGRGFIKTTDSGIGNSKFFDWTAQAGIVIANNDITYFYIDYNAGAPIIATTLDESTINGRTEFQIARVYRSGATVHIVDSGQGVSDRTFREYRRLIELRGFERASGAIISEVGVRNIASTDGVFYLGCCRQTTTGQNTSVADTFTYWYRDGGGGWTEVAAQTQISNTQYDDGTGILANLTGQRYGVHWVYIHYDGDLQVVYGQGNYTLAQALGATLPASVPEVVGEFGTLAAKIIIQRNDPAFHSVQDAYETLFPINDAPDHSDLGNLIAPADDHTQYLLITGTRAMTGNLMMGANWITNDGGNEGIQIDVSGCILIDPAAVGSGYALSVVQADDADGIRIDCDATTAGNIGIDLTAKYGALLTQDISNGYGLYVQRDIAEVGVNPLVTFLNDNAANTQHTLFIYHEGTSGDGINIDSNASGAANWGLRIKARFGAAITQDISNGYGLAVERTLNEAGSNALVNFSNAHASNIQNTLRINQAGTGTAIHIDSNGNAISLNLDSDATTADVINIKADTTSGIVIDANAASLTTGTVIDITNAATSGHALVITQASNAVADVYAIVITNNNAGAGNPGAIDLSSFAVGEPLIKTTTATIDEISIDGTLAGDSDTALPTEQAVRTYAKAKRITGGFMAFKTNGASTFCLDWFGHLINGATDQVGVSFIMPDDCLGGAPASGLGVRVIRIAGVPNINDAQGMMLNIYARAGAANEIATRHVVGWVAKASTTAAAIGFNIFWELTPADDTDMEAFTAWDKVEFTCIGNAAGGGGEAATDAYIGTWEIEYAI